MPIADTDALYDLLACPACRTALVSAGDGLRCDNAGCRLSGTPFAQAGGKVILVDFERSVLDRAAMTTTHAASLIGRERWRMLLTRVVNGTNTVAMSIAKGLARALREQKGRRGRLLVVGGGTVGEGAGPLYDDDGFDVIAFDIYASDAISFVADAHAIPLADASVDAVCVQAVLEHVIDPVQVVAEITRVLRPGGLVFADTPFMWPVHEGAYDFTRWSPSGHRWLFRDYATIASGSSSGPGTASLLMLRYLVSAVTGSTKLGQVVTLPLVWLRLLDRFCKPRRGLDAAAGVFFLGSKSDTAIDAKALVRFYDEQIDLQHAADRLRRGEEPIFPVAEVP